MGFVNVEIRNYGKAFTPNEHWHSDMTFTAHPPKATVLHALTVPPWGGDTLFADQYGAYDSLSDGLKCVVDGLDAEHTGISTAADGVGSVNSLEKASWPALGN